MKLGDVGDGRVYATQGRRVLVEPTPGEPFERRGLLPEPPGDARDRLWARVGDRWGAPLRALVGTTQTTNCWRVTDADLLATLGRHLYSSHDGGWTWHHRRRLPPSAGTMGVLPSGVCVTDRAVYLAPYTADGPDARLLVSDDRGRSWERLVTLDVRHVHCVTRNPYTGMVWLATGDRNPACRIGRLIDGTFQPVVSGDQRFRAVDLAFGPSHVFWGVDSGQVPTRVYRLPYEGGEPTAVHDTPGSVYYTASWTADGVRRIAVSTAIETGVDSTVDEPGTDTTAGEHAAAGEPRAESAGNGAGRSAPAGPRTDGRAVARANGRRPARSPLAAVSVASERSSFEQWRTVATYRKRPCLFDRAPDGLVPTANAYVFLGADSERGLVYNPSNTHRHDGDVRVADLGTDLTLTHSR